MKYISNSFSVVKAHRKLIVLSTVVIVLAGVGLLFFSINNEISEAEINKKVDTFTRNGNCEQGLKELVAVKTTALKEETQEKLLQFRVDCNYKLHNYNEALKQIDLLIGISTKNQTSGVGVQRLKDLKESITLSKKTEDMDRQNEERIQKSLKNGEKDTYDGPLL